MLSISGDRSRREPYRHDAEPGPQHESGQRFFRSARSVAGFVPDRVTTDGHNSYPRAIRSTLGRKVRHRTSVYLNNRLEQDHGESRGGSDVCAASRNMTRPTGSAASMTSSATSSAADPAITNTFQQPIGAVASSIMLASRSVSCRSHDQHNSHRSLHHITARDVTEPSYRHRANGELLDARRSSIPWPLLT